MLRGADYNAADLAEHLRMDATLAARVMAVANSAFFARSPCEGIDDAVNRLGTVQLTRIFAQVLASAALMTPLRAYGYAADGIWRRSLFAAVGSEMTAGLNSGDRSASYMVGLLHQVGMLVVNDLWTKEGGMSKLTFVDFDQEHSEDERNLYGFDQATLGAELLKQLSFPESVHHVIRRQYRNPLEPLACALYMGRLVRSQACDKINPIPNQDVLQSLKISTSGQLDTFLSDVREEAQNRMQGG